MRLEGEHCSAFTEYKEALSHLEAAFHSAKVPVRFLLFVAPLDNKMVEITFNPGGGKKLVCIEGDSPAQAVKDVAAAVRP
ncbi:MAG: hypothetical protein LBB83_03970 [Treponema sp.]|jgi:hypothetical protein|nr:hypothetical protein [Treponema sp.]